VPQGGSLLAKLGEVIGGEHELRQPGAAQVVDFAGGARGHLSRRRAAAGGVEALRKRMCDASQPYPVVMIHGGGGQGLDFLTTADGREGWATDFLRAGYRVYVVDRQGHGRGFYDPDVLGPMGRPASLEQIPALFTGNTDSPENPFAHLHTQWPGSGDAADPATLNFFASMGRAIADDAESHRLVRQSSVALLEKIGPSILISDSAGGAWGWQAADAVPHLVKGIVCIEGAPVVNVARTVGTGGAVRRPTDMWNRSPTARWHLEVVKTRRPSIHWRCFSTPRCRSSIEMRPRL
jgi:pimeloyl-ACP methyl ester carboxylesterase